MKNSFLYLVAATVATLVLGDESTQTTFLRANPKGKSTKKGSKTMLAASCNRAYPGSTPITPPGYKGECKCAVDPTDVESKEAWECPEGFTLEFDEAANDEKTREGMPQYHCIKREAVTEWVTKSEPLLCPTGWTLDKETSKCTYKDPDCVEKCAEYGTLKGRRWRLPAAPCTLQHAAGDPPHISSHIPHSPISQQAPPAQNF